MLKKINVFKYQVFMFKHDIEKIELKCTYVKMTFISFLELRKKQVKEQEQC